MITTSPGLSFPKLPFTGKVDHLKWVGCWLNVLVMLSLLIVNYVIRQFSHNHNGYFRPNHNYNKIVKYDWLSTALISALIGQYAPSCARLKGFLSLLAKQNFEFLVFCFKKYPIISQILLKLWLIVNRTSCCPIQSVIVLVIKQIGLPLCGHSILLITRMITHRIGLHSVLLPLLLLGYNKPRLQSVW